MKAHLVKREGVCPADLIGRILCHDLAPGGPATKAGLRKGHRVLEEDVPVLLRQEWEDLHLVELDEGDLTEEEAGVRLARAIAGAGVIFTERPHGKWELIAAHRGLLKIQVDCLRRLNALHGIAVYTLFSDQVVSEAETVANAQIAPLAVACRVVEEAERIGKDAGELIRVLPFVCRRVGALVTERLDKQGVERFRATLTQKLRWFGCDHLLDFICLPDGPERIVKTIRAFLGSGTDLLLIGGGNALDPLDPLFQGLEAAGARLMRHGMPVHPGTLLWLASLSNMTIVGLPACGMFSHATLFDLLLPRLLAEGKIPSEDLADLGHGGILNKAMAFRFPPYRNSGQGKSEEEEAP